MSTQNSPKSFKFDDSTCNILLLLIFFQNYRCISLTIRI